MVLNHREIAEENFSAGQVEMFPFCANL